MLGKPKQIFISYGARKHPKTNFIIRIIAETIAELRRDGYRIEHRLIDDKYWISESGEISSAVRDEMDQADGAIIILTPSDVGGSAGKTPNLQPRARQNVIHEYGFLQARLPHSNIKVFMDKNIEIPSNLQDFYQVRLPMNAIDKEKSGERKKQKPREDLKAKIKNHTRALAINTIGSVKVVGVPLFETTRKIDLNDFVQSRVSLREANIPFEWGELLREIRDARDRLLACYERIVFDPYLFQLDIWQATIASIEHNKKDEQLFRQLLKGLMLVRRYQQGAGRERAAGSGRNYILEGTELDELIQGLQDVFDSVSKRKRIAPIVRVVVQDYLGLCQLRKGEELKRKKPKKRESIVWLDKSISSFQSVAKTAAEFENASQPVWLSFALFNLARAKKARTDDGNKDWLKDLDRAIIQRDKLCDLHLKVPEIVHMGFVAEYLHSHLYKIDSSSKRDGLRIIKECRPRYETLRGWRGPQFPLRKEVEETYRSLNKKLTEKSSI